MQQNVTFVTNSFGIMITIQEAVDNLLRSKPYLEEALIDGIINITSLARQMRPDVERISSKEVKPGAIVMAISRHNPGKLSMISTKAENLMRNISNIIVRSNISVYTYENSTTLLRNLAELSIIFSEKKGLFYTFSQGVFETTVILNKSAEGDLLNKLGFENQLVVTQGLSCITLYLPDENTEIAGYYYFILKKIAWEGINIVEILSTTAEFSIILNENDVDKAFSVLKKRD